MFLLLQDEVADSCHLTIPIRWDRVEARVFRRALLGLSWIFFRALLYHFSEFHDLLSCLIMSIISNGILICDINLSSLLSCICDVHRHIPSMSTPWLIRYQSWIGCLLIFISEPIPTCFDSPLNWFLNWLTCIILYFIFKIYCN